YVPPYKNPSVMNVLGASPFEQRAVVWSPSKTDETKMEGVPQGPPPSIRCGERSQDGGRIDDIFSDGPDTIFLTRGAATTSTRIGGDPPRRRRGQAARGRGRVRRSRQSDRRRSRGERGRRARGGGVRR